KEGIVTDMFVMSEMFTRGGSGDAKSPTLMDLRVAAAKHGAQALLVIQGDCEVDSYKNPAALLNLTIVGGYIVPASHRAALVELQGALVDVGNGFLYAAIETAGEGRVIRPTFIVEDKPAIEKAKQQALTNFGPELLKRMRAVRANFAQIPANLVTPAAVPITPLPWTPPAKSPPPETLPIQPVSAKSTPPVAAKSDVLPVPSLPPTPPPSTIQPILVK